MPTYLFTNRSASTGIPSRQKVFTAATYNDAETAAIADSFLNAGGDASKLSVLEYESGSPFANLDSLVGWADPTEWTTTDFDENTASTFELVAVSSGKRIEIKELVLQCVGDAANTVVVKSGTTALTGAFSLATLGLPVRFPWIIGNTTEAVNITLSAAKQVVGYAVHRYVS